MKEVELALPARLAEELRASAKEAIHEHDL